MLSVEFEGSYKVGPTPNDTFYVSVRQNDPNHIYNQITSERQRWSDVAFIDGISVPLNCNLREVPYSFYGMSDYHC